MQTPFIFNAPLHLIGAGGLASDFLACFKDVLNVSGCWDDQLAAGSDFNGIPVLGTVNDLINSKNRVQFIITVANPAVRMKIAGMLGNSVHDSPVIIHPDSRLFDKATIILGDGCIIFPGVIITTKVSVGCHSVFHIGTSVHHDVTIGDCSVLMPGVRITGNVTVGNNVFVGPGEALSHGTSIGDGARLQK
jgi:UDP-3-O-[3-hydroxymyristoyl] glucosamine N-acyltransferase